MTVRECLKRMIRLSVGERFRTSQNCVEVLIDVANIASKGKDSLHSLQEIADVILFVGDKAFEVTAFPKGERGWGYEVARVRPSQVT